MQNSISIPEFKHIQLLEKVAEHESITIDRKKGVRLIRELWYYLFRFMI